MNRFFTSICVAAVAASSALAVTANPLPEGVTTVMPRQGRVDVGPNTTPLGVRQISAKFASTSQAVPNRENTAQAFVYFNGSDAPYASATAQNAAYDALDMSIGSILFDRSCTEEGTYRITIPEGIWLLDGERPSPALDLNYEIVHTQTIFPPQGLVEGLMEFRIDFPHYTSVSYDARYPVNLYKVSSPNTYPLSVQTYPSEGEGAYASVLLATPISTEGEYKLQLPSGCFVGTLEDGTTETANEAIYSWTIAAFPAPAIDPEPGIVKSFETFTLTPPDGFTLWMVNDKARSLIYPTVDGIQTADPAYSVQASRNGAQVVLTVLDPETDLPTEKPIVPADGTYRLVLGGAVFSGMYADNFVNSAPFTYDYQVFVNSSVEQFDNTEEDTFNVWTLSGMRVAAGVDRDQLRSLRPGLYIVNGRKVVVK